MTRLSRRTVAAALTALAAATPLALLPAAAQAQEIREHSFKLAQQNPRGHPLVTGAERFAQLVAERSGGRMRVNLFPGGTLGSDAASVTALQAGTIEIVVLNSGILAAQVPAFAVFDFPFMFANGQEADAVVDGSFGQGLHARLAERGIVGLAYWELGFRHLTNNRRPINRVDDIAGLRLRVIPNPINVDWVRTLGANPTPLAFPELYAALESRAVDGQENPLSVILANKFHEVQRHLTLTAHQYNPQSMIFSGRVWERLNAAEQRILREAAIEAGRFQRQTARDAAAGELAELRRLGMAVTELPPAEMARLREMMRPVIERHTERVGADTVRALQAEIARVRR